MANPDVEIPTQKHYSSAKERHYTHPGIQAFAQPKVQWIWDNLPTKANTILEVGAGNGYFSSHLAKLSDLTATDISEHQLKHNPALKKQVCSAYKLPYANNSFDLVIASNLLHHLNDPQKAVDEMHRVSKKFIVFSEPNASNVFTYFGSYLIPQERNARLYSKEYMDTLLSQTNSLTIKHTYIGGLVMPHGPSGFFLKIARPKSTNKHSMFQIFICEKNTGNKHIQKNCS